MTQAGYEGESLTELDRIKELEQRIVTDQAELEQLKQLRPLADDAVTEWPNNTLKFTQWLVQGWIPDAAVSTLAGQGAIGKTRLALQIAVAVATGELRPLLPRHSSDLPAMMTHEKPSPVVWASWETRAGDFQERLRAACGGALEELSHNLTYLNMRPHGALWGSRQGAHTSAVGGPLPAWDKLRRYATEKEAKLLVLDPLAAAYASNENDRSLVRAYLASLAQWADEEGCAVLQISHPPKYAEQPYSGSTDWEAGVQAMLSLGACTAHKRSRNGKEQERCEKRLLSVTKLNEGKLPRPIAVAWDDAAGTLIKTTLCEKADVEEDAQSEDGAASASLKQGAWS